MSWKRKLRSAVSTVRRVAQYPGEKMAEEFRTNKYARRALYTVGAVSGLSGAVAAQTEEASGILCGSGVGTAVGLGLGMGIVLLILIGGIRAMMAFNKMGGSREQDKRDGREQLKGAGLTLGGVFVPGIIAGLFEALGLGGISCVDWGALVPTGGTAAIVTGVTSLPF